MRTLIGTQTRMCSAPVIGDEPPPICMPNPEPAVVGAGKRLCSVAIERNRQHSPTTCIQFNGYIQGVESPHLRFSDRSCHHLCSVLAERGTENWTRVTSQNSWLNFARGIPNTCRGVI